MKSLEEEYKELKNPIHIRSLFKNEIDFIHYISGRRKKKLKRFLKVFLKAEDYMTCKIIYDELKRRKK